ncbi:MAG: cation transporter [Chloroflexi bacterium]|nr:cation transporter [Chloroflexota bacterium]
MSETTSSTTKKAFVGHQHPEGIVGWIGSALHLPGFEHDHGETDNLVVDRAMRDNNIGIITVWLALGALWLTTVIQAILYTYSNSVALLADTAHNLVDALNSIPLLIAFYLARRVATRRFTYGFGRAEDIAGIFIVLSIIYSAIHIMVESVNRFLNPRPLENLELVVLGAIIGFIGNEAVAILQIRTGKRIGSEAMIADGQHARIDGVTSLAVLVAVIGTALNVPILDPIVGMVIGVAIIGIAIQATRKMFLRLMDGVDPSVMNRVEHFAETAPGVESIESLRIRWIGHRLFAEIVATVDETRSLVEGYSVTQNIRKSLYDAIPAMGEVVVSIKPAYAANARKEAIPTVSPGLASLLPPRYQQLVPSAAPMGAAGLKFDGDGAVAWDEIWTDFCDLALAGGPPHRGTLLEPGDPVKIEANPEAYEKVLSEIERGIHMVTGLETVRPALPGWIGMVCDSEEMALWLLRAIVVENVSVRREDKTLFFPAGADFRLEKEIKNVVTVIAKTTHYWQEHVDAAKKL